MSSAWKRTEFLLGGGPPHLYQQAKGSDNKSVDSYARDVQTMRRFIQTSRQKRREHLAAQLERARADFRLITDHIIERYRPERIYQWGSLVDGAGFQEISDIDVAIEGLAQPQEFFHLLGECEELTTFPLHIVNLEEIPARIDQAVAILEEMSARIDHFEAETLPVLGRTNDAVLIPVQLIENGYTAVETLFVRISQAFENNLD
jgi:predicted nucleotidyltransferase